MGVYPHRLDTYGTLFRIFSRCARLRRAMVRSIRSAKLDSRSSRLKLSARKKPYFVTIGQGLSLGYRRNRTAGTWVYRKADGKGGMRTQAFASADDYEESNGGDVLDYFQAIDHARGMAREAAGPAKGAIKVKEAFYAYLPKLKGKNARSARTTEGRVKKHIFPQLGEHKVSELTKTQLETWQASLVRVSEDKEEVRKSKDSANRVLSMLKAFLNHAHEDKSNGIPSDEAWRRVKPFHNVGRPRDVRFSPKDAMRLIDAIEDKSFCQLVEGGYGTGGRYEELTDAKVRHFDLPGRLLTVSGKTGTRHIILQPSAVRLLKRVTKGRSADDFIFVKSDGSKWKPSDQVRPMKAAVRKARLDPDGCFYSLRHAYISESIEMNVPLTVIAENCGTSVRMIEITYAKVLMEKKRKFVERGAPRLH
jgi:integrase